MNNNRLVNNPPNISSCLEDFIAAGENSATISYYNMSILQVEYTEDKTMRIDFTIDNLVNDYLDVLREASVKVPLSDAEQRKYYYNPDLLAFDIYGSTELDFVLLLINGVLDPKDFNMPTLKLVNKSALINILSRIYTAEHNYMTSNRQSNGLIMPD